MLEDQLLEEIALTLEKLNEVSMKLLNSMLYFENLRSQILTAAQKKKTIGVI